MSREAFEAWALRNTSLSSAHDMAWAAWQAALAQPQAELYGHVTTHTVTGQQFFYRHPAPPYLDTAKECIAVYATPQQAQPAPAAPAVPAVPVSWERLRTLMDGIPTREEFIGGQRQKYVAKEAVMGWLYEGQLRAEREAALSAAPAVQPQWLPIESAPRSREELLLVSQERNIRIGTGAYVHHLMHAAKLDGDECYFTHWMPLPAAPGDKP